MSLGTVLMAAVTALIASLFASVTLATAATASPSTFSGRCAFSGPLTPDPPITVVPKSGSHFDYAGAGTCFGTLDGVAVTSTPNTLTFTNVATVFDTCEFGPDVNLAGEMLIGAPPLRGRFPVTVNLARLALVGPFDVVTSGGGAGIGTATFSPPSTAGALEDCAASGIGTASLAGTFSTTSALIGVDAPAPPASTSTTPASPAPATSCRAVRRVVIRLTAPRGRRIVHVLVYLDGHRVLRRSGTRLTSVMVGRLTAGVHTVRVVTRTDRGRTRTVLRRYDICR